MPYKDPVKKREKQREYDRRHRAVPANREKRAAARSASYRANPEPQRAAEKRRRLANPEQYAANQKAWREAYPESAALTRRKQNLKRFGMTPEDYERMHTEQKGLCCICGQPETCVRKGTVMRLAVEHCHKTNRVRGLTCNRCNRTIGMAGDDPALLRAMADYLDAP